MPNRILRDGILTSERVSALNWAEEVFYRRLISVVDDYGRYYANPQLLRAACYPLHLDKVSDADIEKWLEATQKAALVSVYEAPDSKRYLELHEFRQQVRAKASRFPDMRSTCAADAEQVIANAHLDGDEGGDGDEGEGVNNTPPVCPHRDILQAFSERLPMLAQPRLKDWNGSRAGTLKTRWREDSERQHVEWWDQFFAYVAQQPFLVGDNKRDWKPSIDWILKKENFVKILEGNYER